MFSSDREEFTKEGSPFYVVQTKETGTLRGIG
jgi:hypothetical protein